MRYSIIVVAFELCTVFLYCDKTWQKLIDAIFARALLIWRVSSEHSKTKCFVFEYLGLFMQLSCCFLAWIAVLD